MASSIACCKLLLFLLFFSAAAAGFQFEVGDGIGWRKPTGNEPETYNEWAARNRFRIGDSIHFEYQNDTVLVVSPADYLQCNSSAPVSAFDDGDTVYRFDQPGFFYFISGRSAHCRAGQRVIVRVMHASEGTAAAPSLAPASDGGDWGLPETNSTTRLSVASYITTAFVGIFVLFYVFM